MGFVGLALAALLALAVPASIARASLIGALIVLAILVLLAAGGIEYSWRRRGRLSPELGRRPRTALLRLAALAVLYAIVVIVIHVT